MGGGSRKSPYKVNKRGSKNFPALRAKLQSGSILIILMGTRGLLGGFLWEVGFLLGYVKGTRDYLWAVLRYFKGCGDLFSLRVF